MSSSAIVADLHQYFSNLDSTPIRQLPVLYEDDPPPYPGLVISARNRPITRHFLPKRLPINHFHSISIPNNGPTVQLDIQARRWKISASQYHICYTGDLPDHFLRIQSFPKSEIINRNEKQTNREFLTTLPSDQSIRSTSHHFSRKSFLLPTPPTVKITKTVKVRARRLQNILTQIEQGQTIKTSMVLEEPITLNDSYSYGKEYYQFEAAMFNK